MTGVGVGVAVAAAVDNRNRGLIEQKDNYWT